MRKTPTTGRDADPGETASAEGERARELAGAAAYLPEVVTVESLITAEQGCRGCELYKRATQAVGGAGPGSANMVVVGETPGDEEDRKGRPFVGPAGALLDQAMERAGIDRNEVFVTNAVKHFKWEPRGKRRLHSKPSSREIAACRPWLNAELELIQPRVIVCLGATAAQALLGASFRVTKQRGEVMESAYGSVVATYHPAAVLRAPDAEARQKMREALIADLRTAGRLLRHR